MILKNKIGLGVLLVSVFGFSNGSSATPTISSPYVTKGETGIEAKGEYKINNDDDEDNSWATELSISHGVTGFWKAEIGAEYEDEGGDEDGEFTKLEFENVFQLAPKDTFFVDPGLKIEYGHSLNSGADELEGKLLLAKTIGQFSNKTQIGISREFEHDDEDGETTYNFATGVYYDIAENFQFGGEWYSDFGNTTDEFDEQDHMVGPVAFYELAEGIEFETGALIGVSDGASDATLKAVLEYEF